MKFLITEGDIQKSPLDLGTQLDISGTQERPRVFVNGKLADANLTQAVVRAIPLALPEIDGATIGSDEMFGTTERRRVGDTWNGHKDAILKKINLELLRVGSTTEIDASDISSEVRLEKLTTVNGIRCIQVGATVKVEMKGFEMPNGTRADTMSLLLEAVFKVPVSRTETNVFEISKSNAFVLTFRQPASLLNSERNIKVLLNETSTIRVGFRQ